MAETEWLSSTVIRLTAQTVIKMHSSGDSHVSICNHTHAYITSTVLYRHTSILTLTNTQPEAEDLRLCSGTWSQSHLGPEILLCSPQSGLIPCRTESFLCVSLSTYKSAAKFRNSCGSLLSCLHELKGFPASSVLGQVCISGSLWRKFWEGESCNSSRVKLNPAQETDGEERRKVEN